MAARGRWAVVVWVVKATSSTNLGAISSNAPIYVARNNPSADDYYEGLLDDLTFTLG